MSLATAALATSRRPDPLSGLLRALPIPEPESVPGEDWARLQSALGLDVAPGRLLVSPIRRLPVPEGAKPKSEICETIADPSWDRIAALAAQPDLDLYFGLSKVADDWRPPFWKARGDNGSCLTRRFIGVDFDLDFGVHAAGGIRLDDAIRAIERFPVRPAAVVSSGGGLHVYYALSGNADAAAIEWVGDRVNGWFARTICPDAPDLWDTKPTVDIARILRVPGTMNRKGQFETGGAPVPVRFVHADESAVPLTREMASTMPTFAEVRRAALGAPRPRRDVPKVVRIHEGAPPWEEFNAHFGSEDLLADLIERLGGSVSGVHALLPGDPNWESPNTDFSGRIRQGETDMLVTIFEPSVANWWSDGGGLSRFSAFDLLIHVFNGDRSATARYVKRVVLDDVAEWLGGFSWAPADPAPEIPGASRGPRPTAPPVEVVAAEALVEPFDADEAGWLAGDERDDSSSESVPSEATATQTPASIPAPARVITRPTPDAKVLRPVFAPKRSEPDRVGEACPECNKPFGQTASGAWLCGTCEDF